MIQKAIKKLKSISQRNAYGEQLDVEEIGMVTHVEQATKVEVDPSSPSGYKGLPEKWEKLLQAAGFSDDDIMNHRDVAMQVASIHYEGGIDELLRQMKPIKGDKTFRKLMKQAVTLQSKDPYQKFNKMYRLGGGSFGEVYLCSENFTGDKFAMKITKDEKKDLIEREIRMHALCNGHKNIIGFKEAYHYKRHLFLIVEYMNAGSLFDYIYNMPVDVRWKEMAVTYVIREVLKGLAFLHSEYHLHRDIKSQNILINSTGSIKLADFGFAVGLTRENRNRKTVLGTPFWMAPELISKVEYGDKVDVWATGITLLEIVHKEPPHMGVAPLKVIFLIQTEPAPKLKNEKKFTPEFVHLVSKLLDKDPNKRVRSSEALMHPALDKSRVTSKKRFVKLLKQIAKIRETGKAT